MKHIPLTHLLLLPFLLLAVTFCGDSAAEQESRGEDFLGAATELPAGETAGEIPAVRVSREDMTADWPALASGPDGSVWTAYIEWDGEASDRVVVRKRDPEGEWGEPVVLDDGNWDHHSPAIAALPSGAYVVWAGQADGNYELYGATVSDGGEAGKVERLTTARHGDFNARAVADDRGNVTIVWQSFRDEQADIYARRRKGSEWGREVRVSTSSANDWEPDLALDSTGRAWISWDGYHAGNYDVFLASFDGERAGPPIPITSDDKASFHTAVAVDGADRVWVVWDEAEKNWGKDFATSSRVEGSEGLHARRHLRVHVYANGKVSEPAHDVMDAFSGRMRLFAELPRVTFDRNNTPWIVFRHWTILKPHEMFHFYATKLAADGWTTPWRLSKSAGRNTQRADLAIGRDGAMQAVYSSDLRAPDNLPTEQMHALHYNIYLASLPKSEPLGEISLNEVNVNTPTSGYERRNRATMRAGDFTYTLLLGDCHRHTDVRGHSGVDGSLEDTYRYAMDAANMDYVGPSDHNEVTGGGWPDGLRDYQWWMAQKYVDLMTHAPKFWGLYTYEHSMQRPGGHRNILFLKRGAPMRAIDRTKGINAPDNQPPELWEWARENVLSQPEQKLVIVPHTFAAGPLADWNWQNPFFDCLLEIYQGARGSYEKWRLPDDQERGPTQTDEPGHFAQDALNKGNVYGFVSYSDHRSTHNSWAAIWVEEPTREQLFDAMLARHTYAASDEIILKVTADGRMVGEQFSAEVSSPPKIEISVDAPDEILRIDVVKNGEYVFTRRPRGRSAQLTYQDGDPQAGETYYYVRVFQRDPEKPEGDPEIAWSSPFFVEYE